MNELTTRPARALAQTLLAPATDMERAALLTLVQGLNASAAQNWDAQRPIYDMVLSRWPAELAVRVTQHAALNCKWRPSPFELRQIAARLESPRPTEDQALDEVLTLVSRFGAMGKPDPGNPNCRTAGPPPFSHPLIAATVRRLGDWDAVCAGDSQHQTGGLQGAFRAAYNRAVEEWEQVVMDCLDRGERPAEWFPAYVPFAPADLGEIARAAALPAARALLPSPPGPLVPMPDRLREQIETLKQKASIDLDSPEARDVLNARRRQRFAAARSLAELVEGREIPRDALPDAAGDGA